MKQKETAADVMARLNADPEYVARRNAEDAARRRRAEDNERAEAPLLQELREVGLSVNSVWDLVNSRDLYPECVAILLHHFERTYPDAIRAGIARALGVPGARGAWPILAKWYQQEKAENTRQGLAVALSNIADDAVIDELIELARDERQGVSRVLLLDAVRRLNLPHARKILMELGADPLLKHEAQRILRLLVRRVKK